MEDNYTHADDKLIYIVENVPGPLHDSKEYHELLENFNSQLTGKCDCNKKCLVTSCSCVNSSGGYNYIIDIVNANIKLSEDKIKDTIMIPIIECNDICSCSVECGNRLVQKGPLKCLYVKSCTENKGFGLFTSNLIPKHTFICEYAGEVITKTQAENRHQQNVLHEKMNYIFCLNEYANELILQTFVDPSMFGNIGRYVNHSCDPNCVMLPVRINSPIPKLAIFSCTEIPAHSEITFNYGSNDSTDVIPVSGRRTKCLCNASKCTGWIPFQIY